MRYFVELSYKGTAYHGWQSQQNAKAVQPLIEAAFSKVLREEIELTGAGRTDTGVHASYYMAHFDSKKENLHEKGKMLSGVNALLPFDIAIYSIRKVKPDAHARFSALWRDYEYHIVFKKDPFKTDLAWHLKIKPDIKAMNQASLLLLKQNDFASFCKAHSDNKTTICHVTRAEWIETDDELVFHIRADRFLRNMVRAIVGTLLDVGNRKITLNDFKQVLKEKSRSKAGISVPAHGLFLTGIGYLENLKE